MEGERNGIMEKEETGGEGEGDRENVPPLLVKVTV